MFTTLRFLLCCEKLNPFRLKYSRKRRRLVFSTGLTVYMYIIIMFVASILCVVCYKRRISNRGLKHNTVSFSSTLHISVHCYIKSHAILFSVKRFPTYRHFLTHLQQMSFNSFSAELFKVDCSMVTIRRLHSHLKLVLDYFDN